MGKRVLIVDDSADMVSTTAALMNLRGHETRGLYSAVNLAAAIREFDPDIVILDLAMPGKDGLSAAREIRALTPGKRPILIACTAEHEQKNSRSIAKESGFNFYVPKPCDPDFLVALVEAE